MKYESLFILKNIARRTEDIAFLHSKVHSPGNTYHQVLISIKSSNYLNRYTETLETKRQSLMKKGADN